MAVKIEEEYFCKECGTMIIVTELPCNKGWELNSVYCPSCKNEMKKYVDLSPTLDVIRRYFTIPYGEINAFNDRLKKAKEMYDIGIKPEFVSEIVGSKIYKVTSQYRATKYIVTEKELRFTCNCPDHVYRSVPCKHIILTLGSFYNT